MTSAKRRGALPRAKGLLDALERSFRDALRTPDGLSEPVALLWTDADRQWAGLIPRLQSGLPQLFVLGSYTPSARSGPAIWLRCVVDRTLSDVELEPGVVLILYLPGVARQALRAGEECPRDLQRVAGAVFGGDGEEGVNSYSVTGSPDILPMQVALFWATSPTPSTAQ